VDTIYLLFIITGLGTGRISNSLTLADISTNGTHVNNELVGKGKKKILENGHTICVLMREKGGRTCYFAILLSFPAFCTYLTTTLIRKHSGQHSICVSEYTGRAKGNGIGVDEPIFCRFQLHLTYVCCSLT
jgi:hypothetical protein